MHAAVTALLLVVELVVPFTILAPPRFRLLRLTGAAILIGFQIAIAATGNYGFFNLLTIVLCLSLLDDRLLRPIVRLRLAAPGWNRCSGGPSSALLPPGCSACPR